PEAPTRLDEELEVVQDAGGLRHADWRPGHPGLAQLAGQPQDGRAGQLLAGGPQPGDVALERLRRHRGRLLPPTGLRLADAEVGQPRRFGSSVRPIPRAGPGRMPGQGPEQLAEAALGADLELRGPVLGLPRVALLLEVVLDRLGLVAQLLHLAD